MRKETVRSSPVYDFTSCGGSNGWQPLSASGVVENPMQVDLDCFAKEVGL